MKNMAKNPNQIPVQPKPDSHTNRRTFRPVRTAESSFQRHDPFGLIGSDLHLEDPASGVNW